MCVCVCVCVYNVLKKSVKKYLTTHLSLYIHKPIQGNTLQNKILCFLGLLNSISIKPWLVKIQIILLYKYFFKYFYVTFPVWISCHMPTKWLPSGSNLTFFFKYQYFFNKTCYFYANILVFLYSWISAFNNEQWMSRYWIYIYFLHVFVFYNLYDCHTEMTSTCYK